jgi:hypothetical protein
MYFSNQYYSSIIYKVPAVYIYSRRASSATTRTETRLGKRASYDERAACISHLHRSRHTLLLLLQESICLRNSDMHQYSILGHAVPHAQGAYIQDAHFDRRSSRMS